MSKSLLKSIGAVLAGFVTVFVLSTVMDLILESTGVLPSPDHPELTVAWMLVLALAYRCIFTVLGGYITARLAPSDPIRHAIILGCIGTVAAIIGCFVGWKYGNHWYPIALVITAVPCTWLGGKLYK